MAEKFILARAKAGDWVKFVQDKYCICPMQFKFPGHGAYVVVHMPKRHGGSRDSIIQASELVGMTPEEVARHG